MVASIVHAVPRVVIAPLRSVRSYGRGVGRIPRRVVSFVRLRAPRRPIKLHLGCGKRRLEGFINIDQKWSPATDCRCDVVKLPCPDGSVSRIESYHLIEHIPRPQVEQALREWYRVLEPGGVLVIECPDFRKDIEELLAGNETRMYSIFGRQRYPGGAHHWGYTEESLSELVLQAGFAEARAVPAQDYHAHTEPCIRIEATKRAAATRPHRSVDRAVAIHGSSG